MNKTKLTLGKPAREKLVVGINKIADVASETMGQQGNYTIIEQKFGAPKITKDGYYSIKEIELEDKEENQGAQMIKEGAQKSAEDAGDGTTTCCVLTRELVNRGVNMIESGSSRTDIAKGIDMAVKEVCKRLKKMSIPVEKGTKMIEQVATISANNNSEIGKEIAKAMSKISENGVITVDESKSLESYVEVVEGMEIPRGYLSPYFVTNTEKMECVLEKPYILFYDQELSKAEDIIPILEMVTKEARGIIIVAKDINSAALATLIHNKVQGGAPFACIQAPGYGASMMDELEDVALVTGGTVVSETTGNKIEDVNLDMLGEADKVIITRTSTVFQGGKGDKGLIEARVKAIKNNLENISEPYAIEIIEKRLANIDGGIAVFYVGGATETEVGEKMDLIEDAIAATRSANEMGVVPGGGSSLVLAGHGMKPKSRDKGIIDGFNIVKEALSAPLKQIMKNADLSPDVILNGVFTQDFDYAGYDLKQGEYCNMIERGILDTAKVEISALTNAASVAKLVLMGATVETMIEEHK